MRADYLASTNLWLRGDTFLTGNRTAVLRQPERVRGRCSQGRCASICRTVMIWLVSAAAFIVLPSAPFHWEGFYRSSSKQSVAMDGRHPRQTIGLFLGLHPKIAGRNEPEFSHWGNGASDRRKLDSCRSQ